MIVPPREVQASHHRHLQGSAHSVCKLNRLAYTARQSLHVEEEANDIDQLHSRVKPSPRHLSHPVAKDVSAIERVAE